MQVSSEFGLPEVDEFILKVMLCSIDPLKTRLKIALSDGTRVNCVL